MLDVSAGHGSGSAMAPARPPLRTLYGLRQRASAPTTSWPTVRRHSRYPPSQSVRRRCRLIRSVRKERSTAPCCRGSVRLPVRSAWVERVVVAQASGKRVSNRTANRARAISLSSGGIFQSRSVRCKTRTRRIVAARTRRQDRIAKASALRRS